MMKHFKLYLFSVFILATIEGKAQISPSPLRLPLSAAESKAGKIEADLHQHERQDKFDNPTYRHWAYQNDSTGPKYSAVAYTTYSANATKGDFLPFEGNAGHDFRAGAQGSYSTAHSGTLAGTIQYARGKNKNIGWNATRMPEDYFPYISTDSTGGDYQFDTYYAEGSYAFNLRRWIVGAKASFHGEQAYRVSDPRALNNTTWLKFNAALSRILKGRLLMAQIGYARNKQHMQLRYWRPGEQNRFFVCYGFGLYDVRQSAVSFGKSRMYYIHQCNAKIQYISTAVKNWELHASIGYAYEDMKTEESDIYNLYEARTRIITPLLDVTYQSHPRWKFALAARGRFKNRKGYENIIEEYLIDKANNIYDFRIIDTQQNYNLQEQQIDLTASAQHHFKNGMAWVQGGTRMEFHEQSYKNGNYMFNVRTQTPHAKVGASLFNDKNTVECSLLYGRQILGGHNYDVNLVNSLKPHLDFQHAFTPYAYRACELNLWALDATYLRRFTKFAIGLNGRLCLEHGNRAEDAAYDKPIHFKSSAPLIQSMPDVHRSIWGATTLFVQF